MQTIPWEQVRDVVDAVLDLPPEARISYLDQACPEPSLRRYVESLVQSYEQAGGFLDEPAAVRYAPAQQEAASWTGRQLGPYQIVEQIGKGGMGEVYRAVRADDQYQKQVAIKLVRGGFDSRFTLARFKAERQILANLDHPNITRLLDGGATGDGQPYLVMEYVQGVPVDEHCDQHKLTVTERLRLFQAICSAVQYAHQLLVIHRDIKPGNILVTDDGAPKLLDFGIAKILDPDQAPSAAIRTLAMVRMLTPEYASPEQLLGEAITTASDVYSLGVVLYELLTGHRPYRLPDRAPEEIARTLADAEPEKPSAAVGRVEETTDSAGKPLKLTPDTVSRTREGSPEKLRRRLTGDLDNIVLMALHAEPQRRYSSVEQFSEDIRRHLEGLPVIARADTFTYRSAKFVRRHRLAVTAAALAALSLTAGLAMALREAQIARAQRVRAERRFNDVRQLANSLMMDIHDAIRDLPGSTPARKLLVDRALEYLDSLARESSGDPSLQRELAAAYEKVGMAQDHTGLGDLTGAVESYRKALALRRTLVASKTVTSQDRLLLARTCGHFGYVQTHRGNLAAALDLDRESVQITEALREADPGDPSVLAQLQLAYDALGDTLSSNAYGGGLGRLAEASEIHRKAVELGEARTRLFPKDVESQRALAVALGKAGDDLVKTGERKKALACYLREKDIAAKLAAELPDNALMKRDLAASYSEIGDLQVRDGDLKSSLESYQRMLSMNQAAALADPKNERCQEDLVVAYQSLGYAETRLGRIRDARSKLTAARDIAEKVAKADPGNAAAKDLWAYCEAYLGDLEQRTGNHAQALANYRSALTIWEPLAAAGHNDVDTQLRVASTENEIGQVLAREGRSPEATAMYRKSLAGAQGVATANPLNEWALYVVADSTSGLGDVFSDLASKKTRVSERIQAWGEARSWYQRSAEAWRQVHNPGAMSPGSFDCGSPRHVSAMLSRCGAALAKLQTSSVAAPAR